MPRARKARLSDDVRAELFARWHIRDMEISHADGVTQVKHAMLGWMSAEDYYRLQKVHDVLPLLEKVIEGGYRAKAALWSLNVSVGPVSLPLGAYIPLKGLLMAEASFAAGDTNAGVKWLAALALPFGDILILAQIVAEVKEIADTITESIAQHIGPLRGNCLYLQTAYNIEPDANVRAAALAAAKAQGCAWAAGL